MGNFRRHHSSKNKGENRTKSVKKEEKIRVKEEEVGEVAGGQVGGVVGGVDASQEEEETKKKAMVVLHTQDGVDLVVSKADACRCGNKLEVDVSLHSRCHDAYPQTRIGCNKDYPLIGLLVESDILSKVLHYSNNQHASCPSWDAVKFVGDLDHATLFDLILAAEYLQNQGLLDLTCQTVNDMIAGKSPNQIRAMFGIRTPPHGELTKNITPEQKQQLKKEERALRALRTVRCQEFTAYDPQLNCFVPTRFCHLHNFAFFDYDKESEIHRGPPLHEIPPPMRESLVESSVNFISLKVCVSDVGFPINVFGTVIARDKVDYRCVYLFRREADDSQIITSPDDELTLMDPCRGLVPNDSVYFEFNLKIKCDGGAVKDFSRGVMEFDIGRLGYEKKSMTLRLISWLSSVELLCANVLCPLEASISINILKGTCNLTRVAAWTTGNSEDRIILYGTQAVGSTRMATMDNSIALARRVVAVPIDEELMLHLVVDDDETEDLVLTIGNTDDEQKHVCKMDCGEMEVKAVWTAVPKRRKRCNKWEYVGNQRLLL